MHTKYVKLIAILLGSFFILNSFASSDQQLQMKNQLTQGSLQRPMPQYPNKATLPLFDEADYDFYHRNCEDDNIVRMLEEADQEKNPVSDEEAVAIDERMAFLRHYYELNNSGVLVDINNRAMSKSLFEEYLNGRINDSNVTDNNKATYTSILNALNKGLDYWDAALREHREIKKI